ncbi:MULTISPECIES: hypothetical protein [unclassified Nonomuraea]|nr:MULTISPECIES: hypothetical protein [unclassified Nonomuraea]
MPDSTEVGYDIQGDHAVLVAQRLVRLRFSNGVEKLYPIKAVLLG